MTDGERAPLPPAPLVGVGCVIVRENRVLLMKRANRHGLGSWSTPGGHLDHGESPAECARREVMEEVGLELDEVGFLAITDDRFPESRRHYITIWMAGRVDSGEISILARDEIAELGWFDLGDLPEPLFTSFAHLVAGESLPPDRWPPRGRQSLLPERPI